MDKQSVFDDMYLDICELMGKRMSKCVKHKVAAIITRNDRIIVTGYNGTPSGYINCCDHFRDYDRERDRVAHREWSRKYEIHAEINAISFAAKTLVSTDGCTLYCNLQPCHDCLKAMIQAGITRVVYGKEHHIYPEETLRMTRGRITIVYIPKF